ncbi:ferredoxin-fold anticodon-binding domain-containing protein 1 [Nephila pilipes]|uniref:Ferredoxin-fold anticodon-binding domain-containing protein 1 n=1 Tax=Nephila pilipes TaxID=299642 RepID=A0A8X6UKI3_NEPPI|nr:ferredoxin-fold anticodon-binding domain-containing protein 1 [Nephila pilipes]
METVKNLKPDFNFLCGIESTVEKNFTLFVGEGNFSFAANYVQNLRKTECEYIIATALITSYLNSEEKSNIEFIKSRGGTVYTDVDAMKLEQHPIISKYQFSKIFFHFPHVPKKMNIKENRALVEHFLISAEKILQENGRISVTLCRKQGGTNAELMPRLFENTWKIVNLASSATLILCEIEFFNYKQYESYKCSGYRGLSKQFDVDGAVTHIFSRGKPVSLPNDSCKSILYNNNMNYFIQTMKNLYESLSRKIDVPYFKMMCALDAVAVQVFDKIFIDELLICGNFLSFMDPTSDYKEKDYCDRTNLCDNCLDCVISAFLNSKKNDDTITFLACSICCVNCFQLHNPLFTHLVAYFSSSDEFIERCLTVLLEMLKFEIPSNTSDFCWLDSSKHLNMRTVVADQFLSSYNREYYQSIYAVCSVRKSNCYIFYTDVEIILEHNKNFCPRSGMKNFEIGHVIKFINNSKTYKVILLNLELISSVKYHIMENRILLLNDAYFCKKVYQETLTTVYRSISLYPPSYVHDVSFWINENFQEKYLFTLAWNVVGALVKNISLIDVYRAGSIIKESRCYRFEYQSFNRVLTKENALKLHMCLRNAMENILKVQLR